jgi:uncharacterized membrane protein
MAAGPILFEAICTPPRSFSPAGFRVMLAAALLVALLAGGLFLSLGAWPVFGFMGGEFALVLGLVWQHQRWSRQAVELVVLAEDGLTIRRQEARGRPVEARFDPYWTRLQHEERPGHAGRLTLRARDRVMEIGRYLNAEEKRQLAAALDGALRRYREPRFDNPQLREDGAQPQESGAVAPP